MKVLKKFVYREWRKDKFIDTRFSFRNGLGITALSNYQKG